MAGWLHLWFCFYWVYITNTVILDPCTFEKGWIEKQSINPFKVGEHTFMKEGVRSI